MLATYIEPGGAQLPLEELKPAFVFSCNHFSLRSSRQRMERTQVTLSDRAYCYGITLQSTPGLRRTLGYGLVEASQKPWFVERTAIRGESPARA